MRKAKQNARSPSKTMKNSLRRMFFAGFHVGQKSKCKNKSTGKKRKAKTSPRRRTSRRDQDLCILCLRNAARELSGCGASDTEIRKAARADYKNAVKDKDFRAYLHREYE